MFVGLVTMRRGMAKRQRLNEDEQRCQESQPMGPVMVGRHGYSVTF